jgi:hypothetical protein
MAASPLIHRDVNGDESQRIAEPRPLTHLKKENDRETSPQVEKEEGGDLAEQMNDQNRRKFVKGE